MKQADTNLFFVKINGGYQRILLHDIIYIEASRNYVKIITEERPVLLLRTMKQMELRLPAKMFCRIHKSVIVSIDRISHIGQTKLTLCSQKKGELSFVIGSQYRAGLMKRIKLL